MSSPRSCARCRRSSRPSSTSLSAVAASACTSSSPPQRPRGAVGDAIRANTNLRIAMRRRRPRRERGCHRGGRCGGDPGRRPGRAIALTGRQADGSPSLTTFQAAYAGGRTAAAVAAPPAARDRARRAQPAIGPRPRPLPGRWGASHRPPAAGREPARPRRSSSRSSRPSAPWLPPLPSTITPDDLEVPPHGRSPSASSTSRRSSAGRMLLADLERDGSLLVYGASASGKTVLLQTLARALASVRATQCDPALRAGLRQRRPAHHPSRCPTAARSCAATRANASCACSRSLRRTLRDRKAAGGARTTPAIVLFVDGYGAFASAYERVDFGEPVAASRAPGGGGPPARAPRRRHGRSAGRRARRARRRRARALGPAPRGSRGARHARRPALGDGRRAARRAGLHPGRHRVPGRLARGSRGLRRGAARSPRRARAGHRRAADARVRR